MTSNNNLRAAFEQDLSRPQAWMLCEALRNQGRLSSKQILALEAPFSRAVVSYSFKQLQEKGLAKIHAVARQSSEIRLTTKGRRVAEKLNI